MKKPLFKSLLVGAMSLTMAFSVSAVAFAADGESEAVTNWTDLYASMGITAPAGEGLYDAVTSATNFTSKHAGDIPLPVHKLTDAEGNVTALDGIVRTNTAEDKTVKVDRAVWAKYDDSFKPNKRYGTDKLTIYLDTTSEGYDWTDLRQNIYAVTLSDGTTTVGAVPWVDFYVQKGHDNYIDLAVNTGKVFEGVDNAATVRRFDAFYTDGVLNAGNYTMTVYAQGYAPIAADVVVPTYTAAKAAVADADVSAADTAITLTDLPADYDAVYTVDGAAATVTDGKLSIAGLKIGSHNLTISDQAKKYNDITTSFTVKTEAAAAEFNGTALVAAEGVSAEDFVAYIKNIASVTINGTQYNASGKGSVKVIGEDGSFDLSKTAFAEVTEPLDVVIAAAGYPNLAVSYGAAIAPVEEPTQPVDDPTQPTDTPTTQVTKKANTITVKAKTVTLQAKKVKKAAQKVAAKKAFSVSKAQGKVTYAKASGNKKITVASSGKITVKKGLKKGTYKVKVKVKAAGNKNYKVATKTVTLKIKIK